MRKLTRKEIGVALKDLHGWRLRRGELHKEYIFRSFDAAIAFINRLRPIANAMNHHPEIYNVYDRVTLDLVTHDSGGITKLDVEFARKVEKLK